MIKPEPVAVNVTSLVQDAGGGGSVAPQVPPVSVYGPVTATLVNVRVPGGVEVLVIVTGCVLGTPTRPVKLKERVDNIMAGVDTCPTNVTTVGLPTPA